MSEWCMNQHLSNASKAHGNDCSRDDKNGGLSLTPARRLDIYLLYLFMY